VWAEQQLTDILQTVTDWERRSAVLVNRVTGEQAAYSVANVLALLLDKPLTPPVDNALREAENGEAETWSILVTTKEALANANQHIEQHLGKA